MFKGEPSKKTTSLPTLKKLSVKKRMCLVLSIIYPIAAALYLKPSSDNFIPYISIGIIPVLFVWAIVWIFAGRKK
jgi:hypothetical protein